MGRHGSLPTVAPVNPYTEFAEIWKRYQRDLVDLTRGSYLQSQLSTIQHGTFERVRLLLEIILCSLTSSQQILENCRQESFTLIRLDEIVWGALIGL